MRTDLGTRYLQKRYWRPWILLGRMVGLYLLNQRLKGGFWLWMKSLHKELVDEPWKELGRISLIISGEMEDEIFQALEHDSRIWLVKEKIIFLFGLLGWEF